MEGYEELFGLFALKKNFAFIFALKEITSLGNQPGLHFEQPSPGHLASGRLIKRALSALTHLENDSIPNFIWDNLSLQNFPGLCHLSSFSILQ